jgi:urease accessory protein
VLELQAQPWLVLRVLGTARALELGHFAGSMHWKVRFDGDRLCIALNGSRDDALKRLAHLLARGGVDVEPASALPSDGARSDEELGHGHGPGHANEHGGGHERAHGHGHGHAHGAVHGHG